MGMVKGIVHPEAGVHCDRGALICGVGATSANSDVSP